MENKGRAAKPQGTGFETSALRFNKEICHENVYERGSFTVGKMVYKRVKG